MLRFHILHIFRDYTIFFINFEINEYFLFFLFFGVGWGWGWGVAVEEILEDFISEIESFFFSYILCRERSGSVVECLTRDRRAAGSSLTGVTALWSLSKTHLS